MLSVRVFFKKQGALSYISHLDLNRAVLRAFARSELPVVYSEGFNPHPRLTFSQPMSLFQESLTEIFDFKVDPDIPYDEIQNKLSAALPKALEITKVAAPVKKLTEITYALYYITIMGDTAKVADILKGEIVVFRSTKSKSEYVDISNQIKSADVINIDGGVRIEAVLSTSPTDYLNPQYIIDYLSKNIEAFDSKILRVKMYDSDMKEFE
ncbi:MAG: hypothetical protein A2Y17_03660 [Clostridiales bacterium GWF2_38_85]|nr:MAG: hypothetical protein A2Y17_03660 [Clostridiales bacterium GWF2_38_85]HBL85305.1 hypothetical protein [Clostridiales bacterium]